MLQFKNSTPFRGTILLVPDAEGVDSLYTIVKGTFTIGERVAVAEEQLPVTLADRYRGEPGRSSLAIPSELGLAKPGTDVLLLGSAYSARGRPASQVGVTLNVGPIRKTIRVFGDRVWGSTLLGARISEPRAFEKMPLIWERAFGGIDETDGPSPQTHGEDRNPVGTGFRDRNSRRKPDGVPLPNLEDPKQLIALLTDRPTPSGFGPICPHWQPRRSFAGTYDETWLRERAPYLPEDFDSRFFQLAPSDQTVPGYLKGGEPIEIQGASPVAQLRFNLPIYRPQVIYRLDNQAHVRSANLDTVLIEPDDSRLVMVWRAVFPCDKKALRIRETEAVLGSAA